jgi:hypothetical protein
VADIVFVLDSSGSIRDQNPADASYDNWDLILQFVVRVIENLDIGSDASRVGLVTYSNQAVNKFFMNQYYDKDELIAQVRRTEYIGGTTNTSGGLRLMTNEQFIASRGDRPNVNNVGIVITDGESNEDVERVIPDARNAENRGIKVFAIGITNAVNTQELANISSLPQRLNENWWTSPEFTTLNQIIQQVTQAICVTTPVPDVTDNLYCRDTCCHGLICFCLTASPVRSINGTSCVDINECEDENGDCEGQCVNTEGSYECRCPSGFRLGENRHECEDVNECLDRNVCQGSGTCVNTWGGYYCIGNVFRSPNLAAVASSLTADGTLVASSNTVNAASGTGLSTVGTIVAVVLSVMNLALLTVLAVRFIRNRKNQQNAEGTQGLVGRSNGAFRSDAGTIRSFNSLASKFGPSEGDDVSMASTISS